MPPAGAGGGPGSPERGERSSGVLGSHRTTGSQGTDSCLTCKAQIRCLQNLQPPSALVRRAAVPHCVRHPSRGSRGAGPGGWGPGGGHLAGAAPSLGKAHILSSLPACKPIYAVPSGRFAAQRAGPRPCLTLPPPQEMVATPARHRGRRPETPPLWHSGRGASILCLVFTGPRVQPDPRPRPLHLMPPVLRRLCFHQGNNRSEEDRGFAPAHQ